MTIKEIKQEVIRKKKLAIKSNALLKGNPFDMGKKVAFQEVENMLEEVNKL